MKNDNVTATLEQVVALFESGNVPATLAKTVLENDVPARKWSFLNQLAILTSNTSDARGYKQWKEVGRYVKQGSKTVHILAPRIVKWKEEDENGEEVEVTRVKGFFSIPVFRYEDTEGDPLPSLEPQDPPLLKDVADKMGLSVKYAGFLGHYYGAYDQRTDEIELATHDVPTFFHELAHATDKRLNGELQSGQQWDQECVAELCAATLARLYNLDDTTGTSYNYIKHYAEREGLSAAQACVKVLKWTEKVIRYLLDSSEEEK